MRIGVTALSAPVGKVELEMGLERLFAEDWSVNLHKQTKQKHLFFAGHDEDRANAFVQLAYDPAVDVIWLARGGYGAFRALSKVREICADRPKPQKKLVIGYSDATAVLSFAREHWGWSTLHAPMCGTGEFSRIPKPIWSEIRELASQGKSSKAHKLKWWTDAPKAPIEAEVIGGNLAVWLSLMGTPLQPASPWGKILFLEDVDEGLYRLDRMFKQLVAMGGLDGVKALVLGTFDNCNDGVMNVLVKRPPQGKVAKNPAKQPLRPKVPQLKGLKEIFVPDCAARGIPVGFGLQVGHGGGFRPLALGATYRIDPKTGMSLARWNR